MKTVNLEQCLSDCCLMASEQFCRKKSLETRGNVNTTNMVIRTTDILWEEFEDTKEAIRIRISKDRQYNGQKIKYKKTNNDLQNIHIKLKIE